MHRITQKYVATQLLTGEFDATDQKDSQSFLNSDLITFSVIANDLTKLLHFVTA